MSVHRTREKPLSEKQKKGCRSTPEFNGEIKLLLGTVRILNEHTALADDVAVEILRRSVEARNGTLEGPIFTVTDQGVVCARRVTLEEVSGSPTI